MLGPHAEQIHSPTALRSPCQLGSRVQAFTVPLHTTGLSRSAWLCPLHSACLIPKAVSAANWLMLSDPCSWHGQCWQEGWMRGHVPDPNTMQLQGQPRVTKQGNTEVSPQHPFCPHLFSSTSFVTLEMKGDRKTGE